MFKISKGKYVRRGSSRAEEKELEQAFQEVIRSANSRRGKQKTASDTTQSETMVIPGGELKAKMAAPKPKKNKNKKIIAICASIAAAVLLICIGIGVWFYFATTADNGLILDNVYVGDINLGGMTPEQATAALHNATDNTLGKQSMLIQLPDAVLELSPQDTKVKLDIDLLVETAFRYGREGSRAERMAAMAAAKLTSYKLDLLSYMTIDTGFIQDALDQFAQDTGSPLTQTEITVEGTRPTAAIPEGFYPPDGEARPEGEAAPDPTKQVHQTLTITLGTPGRTFDTKDTFNRVMDAYNRNCFDPIAVEYNIQQPHPFYFDAMIQEYCSDPVDAKINEEDYSIIPEIWGYGCDRTAAAALINSAKPGQSLTISLTYQRPTVIMEDLQGTLFQDVLAAADTWYYYHPDRTTNLRLACEAINGYIVKPGEIFSFNEVVGERTEEKGYKPAGAYVGGETVDQIGGGVCQVASTIYYCSLYADLEIVERYEHMYSSDYVPLGMDATINWGTLDYRFRNNTGYPIRIEAWLEDGCVCVILYGTDTKSYYVVMDYEVLEELEWEVVEKEMKEDNEKGYVDGETIQTPYMGYVVDTWKYRYDKETDEFISRTFEAHSEYDKRDKHVCKILKPTEPTTVPTVGTEAPTEPTETEPTLPPIEEPLPPISEA